MKLRKKLLSLALIVILLIPTLSFADTVESTIDQDLQYLKLMIDYVKQHYYKDVTDEELMDAIYKGMFDTLDDYSLYYNKEEYNSFNQSVTGSYVGVGIVVSQQDDYLKINSLIEGGPASRSTLLPEDVIIEVDGVDVKGFGLEKTVAMIKGEAGSVVVLGVRREGVEDLIIVTLVRELIVTNPVQYKLLDESTGYLKIEQFTSSSEAYVIEALEFFAQTNIDGLVIDVRNNPGGSLQQVINIADKFLDVGRKIIHIDYKSQEDLIYESTPGKVDYELVVLVDENSASASEILAASLQDNDRAEIVGKTTYGKGTVQVVTPISNGGAIKLTIAEYLTPLDKAVNGIGVTPDYEVEETTTSFEELDSSFSPMDLESRQIRGDVNPDVLGAQQRLSYIGFDINTDGKFTRETELVIASFQYSQGLPDSGILDKETKIKLIEAVNYKVNNDSIDAQLNKAVELLAD